MSDPHGPSNEVLGVKLEHISKAVDRLLVIAEKSATRDEVQQADAALSRRVDVLETAVAALKESNTSTMAVVNLAKWVVGIGGLTMLGAFARWYLSSQ